MPDNRSDTSQKSDLSSKGDETVGAAATANLEKDAGVPVQPLDWDGPNDPENPKK